MNDIELYNINNPLILQYESIDLQYESIGLQHESIDI